MNTITIEKIGLTKVKATVEADPALWKESIAKSERKLASQLTLKGFRKGEAPLAMARRHLDGMKVMNEAIDSLLDPLFREVLQKEELHPAYSPSVSVTKLSDSDLTLVYEMVLVPTCALGAIEKLEAKEEAPSVTEEEVEARVKRHLEENADLVPVERESRMGDTLVMDFKGFLPDEEGNLKEFEGGAAEGFSLELGSHQFVPGFEEGCVGLKAGEEKDIKVTFPTTYVKDLAGKEATFHVHVLEVKEKEIPALEDEAVKELGIKGVESVSSLKEKCRADLLREKERAAKERFEDALLEEACAKSEFLIDPEILDRQAKESQERFKKQVEGNGLTLEQYLEITGQKEEDLLKSLRDQDEKALRHALLIEAIIKEKALSVSEEELSSEIKRMGEQYGIDEERVREIVLRDKRSYERRLLEEKAKAWLRSLAK